MATLTSEQLSDLQADLGISADETVFTDDELNRLFTRAESDYETTVAYGYRQLWSQALRFTKYTQGRSSEDKTEIRKALKEALDYWEAKAGIAGGKLTSGTMKLGLDQVDDDA